MSKELTTTRGTITIREAVPEDAEVLFALRLEALSSQPEAFAADYARTEGEGAGSWAQLVADNVAENRGVIFVAGAEGRLAGMTGLVRGHWPKTRHSGIIWGVYVRPVWRGLGVADELIEACLTWGRAQGLTVAKLGVVTTNTAAIRCYARCGFTVYGVEPQVIHYQGVLYDELLMARAI
jgi:RimJ/RimL family protein N-acetyltransferase